jgi:hypothetical protein
VFFRRRPFFYMRRPWLRRRFFYRRWGCLPGCFTLVLLGLVFALALAALLA